MSIPDSVKHYNFQKYGTSVPFADTLFRRRTAVATVANATIVTTTARLIITFATPDKSRKTGISALTDTTLGGACHDGDDQRTACRSCLAIVRVHRRLLL